MKTLRKEQIENVSGGINFTGPNKDASGPGKHRDKIVRCTRGAAAGGAAVGRVAGPKAGGLTALGGFVGCVFS